MKLLTFICSIFLLFAATSVVANSTPYNSIQSLVFNRNQLTTSRVGAPMMQLQCDGGCSLASLRQVMCTNAGSAGGLPNWVCTAEDMPNNVVFGSGHRVSCEGYERPGDSNVLVGSCGFKYTLESKTPFWSSNSDQTVGDVIALLFAMIIVAWVFIAFVGLISGNGISSTVHHYSSPYPSHNTHHWWYPSSNSSSWRSTNSSGGSSGSSGTSRRTTYATSESR